MWTMVWYTELKNLSQEELYIESAIVMMIMHACILKMMCDFCIIPLFNCSCFDSNNTFFIVGQKFDGHVTCIDLNNS